MKAYLIAIVIGLAVGTVASWAVVELAKMLYNAFASNPNPF